jgi:hypothetical protein
MASSALEAWQIQRQRRIDELLAAHAIVGGSGPGRRWDTEQLNWALTLRVAGEFQGFARDLHDLAVDHFVTVVARGDDRLSLVLRLQLTENRTLDRGNATPGAIGADYRRFGLSLWDALRSADYRAHLWNRKLELLNEARNAIAHANDAKLVALRERGYPIKLKTVRRWKDALDGLAATMDDVVSDYLDSLLGGGRPW